MKHLDMHDILIDDQHGFRKSRSCMSQLIMPVQDLADSLNGNEQVDGIRLDFRLSFGHCVVCLFFFFDLCPLVSSNSSYSCL